LIVFESNPGKVIRLRDPALQAQARTINFQATNVDRIDFDFQKSIITRVMFGAQVNVQFLHTLGNNIYVYVFGDRVGQLVLSGLAFGAPCPVKNNIYGAEEMYSWYKTRNASGRAEPLNLLIGNKAVLTGFAVTFNEEVVDAASSLTQWSVTMALIPDVRVPATRSGAGAPVGASVGASVGGALGGAAGGSTAGAGGGAILNLPMAIPAPSPIALGLK
jgi:hypothetical protein